jgi:hypothetical protein
VGVGRFFFWGEERGERGGCFISPQKDPGIVAPGVSLKQDYGTQSTICCVDACENAGGGVEPLARSPVWDVPLRASRRRKVQMITDNAVADVVFIHPLKRAEGTPMSRNEASLLCNRRTSVCY